MITQHFILHMVPNEVRPKIYLSQRSAGLEKLQFSIIGTNGQYYTIPSNTAVTFVGTKPDKKTFSYACTYSGSTVVCDVTEQMTAVAGLVNAELRFANNSGAMIPSQNIDIVVERSPLDGTVCSRTDLVSVEDEVISISQDVALAKRYAEMAVDAGTQSVADITDIAETATSNITNTAESAESSITATAESATSEITALSETTMDAFEYTVEYVSQYGTSGVAMEYLPGTESFKISSISS